MQKLVSTVGFLIAGGCACAAVIFAYKAGCAGDVKTGAFGDPVAALRLENESALALCAMLLVGAASALIWPGSIAKRLMRGLACIPLSVFVWFALFLEVERLGLQACFGHG